jgi:hypothetical protein
MGVDPEALEELMDDPDADLPDDDSNNNIELMDPSEMFRSRLQVNQPTSANQSMNQVIRIPAAYASANPVPHESIPGSGDDPLWHSRIPFTFEEQNLSRMRGNLAAEKIFDRYGPPDFPGQTYPYEDLKREAFDETGTKISYRYKVLKCGEEVAESQSERNKRGKALVKKLAAEQKQRETEKEQEIKKHEEAIKALQDDGGKLRSNPKEQVASTTTDAKPPTSGESLKEVCHHLVLFCVALRLLTNRSSGRRTGQMDH